MEYLYNNDHRHVKHIGSRSNGIQVMMCGIYVEDDMIYLYLRIRNYTNISFEVDFVRFSVVETKVRKRTPQQIIHIEPTDNYYSLKVVEPKNLSRSVYVLPKFTIQSDQLFLLEIMERNGGRHQTFSIEGKDINKARKIVR